MSTGRESAVCGGAGPGDKRRGRAGSSAHTNTTAPRGPPAAVRSWRVVAGALPRQTDSPQVGSTSRTEACGW